MTGVQTCALPILVLLGDQLMYSTQENLDEMRGRVKQLALENLELEIGRASCRERV